jgi:hypothetical protein
MAWGSPSLSVEPVTIGTSTVRLVFDAGAFDDAVRPVGEVRCDDVNVLPHAP